MKSAIICLQSYSSKQGRLSFIFGTQIKIFSDSTYTARVEKRSGQTGIKRWMFPLYEGQELSDLIQNIFICVHQVSESSEAQCAVLHLFRTAAQLQKQQRISEINPKARDGTKWELNPERLKHRALNTAWRRTTCSSFFSFHWMLLPSWFSWLKHHCNAATHRHSGPGYDLCSVL